MAILINGIPNYCLEKWGTTSTSLQTPTLNPSNAQDPLLDSAFRADVVYGISESNASDYWQCDFGEDRTVDCVSLHAHNLSKYDTWTVRLNDTTSFANPLYDSGPLSPFASTEWYATTYTSTESSIPVRLRDTFTQHAYHYFPESPVSARYMQLTLSRVLPPGVDQGSVPSYWQLGHVIASIGFMPTIDMSVNWAMGINDLSEVTITEGGVSFTDSKPRLRTVSLSFPALNEEEAFVRLYTEWYLSEGASSRVFIVPQPERLSVYYAQAVFGRAGQIEEIVNPLFNTYTHKLKVTETL